MVSEMSALTGAGRVDLRAIPQRRERPAALGDAERFDGEHLVDSVRV